MIIRKEYKFYAAHRNETLANKCRNLHGHRYGLTCFFEVERDGDISTLFGDFDAKVEPLLKEHYDHGLLINRHDPLLQALQTYVADTGDELRMNIFDRPTSVENLAHKLFSEITELGFRLSSIEIRETDTSVLQYTRNDWVQDNRHFAASSRAEIDA